MKYTELIPYLKTMGYTLTIEPLKEGVGIKEYIYTRKDANLWITVHSDDEICYVGRYFGDIYICGEPNIYIDNSGYTTFTITETKVMERWMHNV